MLNRNAMPNEIARRQATKRRRLTIGIFLIISVALCTLTTTVYDSDFFRRMVGMPPAPGSESIYHLDGLTIRMRNNWSRPELSSFNISCPEGIEWTEPGRRFEMYDFALGSFTMEPSEQLPESTLPPIARDIDADGVKDILLRNWHGSGFTYYIVCLSDTPHVAAHIDLNTSWFAPGDRNGDGIWEFETEDDGPLGKDYYKAMPGRSGRPPVILGLGDTDFTFRNVALSASYQVRLDRMVDDYAESLAQWRAGILPARRDNVAADSYIRPPSALPQILLNYVYFGDGQKARALLDKLWPPENPNKQAFIREFEYELTHNCRWWEAANEATPPEKRWPLP